MTAVPAALKLAIPVRARVDYLSLDTCRCLHAGLEYVLYVLCPVPLASLNGCLSSIRAACRMDTLYTVLGAARSTNLTDRSPRAWRSVSIAAPSRRPMFRAALTVAVTLTGANAFSLPMRAAVATRGGAWVAMSEDKEDKLGAAGGHAVGGKMPEISEEEQAIQKAVMEHQRGAARLSQAEDARALISYSTGYATLATLSAAEEGYPSAALVGYAVDAKGLPVFCFSAMSTHTKDLMAAERTYEGDGSYQGGKAAL